MPRADGSALRATTAALTLLELLRSIEWEGESHAHYCPRCRMSRQHGHAAGCELAAAIDRAGKVGVRFDTHIDALRAAARAHGYALAVHGSLARDIDLIAAPWTKDAAAPDVLIEALRAACGGYSKHDENAPAGDYTRRSPEPKPHGRLAYTIYPPEGVTYFDIAVLPCAEAPAHRAELEAARRDGYSEGLSDGITGTEARAAQAEATRDAAQERSTADALAKQVAVHELAIAKKQIESLRLRVKQLAPVVHGAAHTP